MVQVQRILPESKEYWLMRAEEAWAMAEQCRDSVVQASLLNVAICFEQLARYAPPESELLNALHPPDDEAIPRGLVSETSALPKHTEKALRSQATLLELAHDAIIVRGPTDEVTFWSRGAEETYGWTREEALGRVTHELLRTDFPKPLAELMGEVAGKGQGDGELIHTRKDGQVIVVASRWAIQRDETECPVQVMEINRDITERKKAESALRESEERLRRVSDIADVGLTRCSRDLIYVSANPAYAKIAGKPLDEIIGHSIPEVIGPAVFRAIEPYIRRVLAGETVEFEKEIRYNGKPTIADTIYVPDRDDQGTIRGWVASLHDVTARRCA